jgi:glycerate kinase
MRAEGMGAPLRQPTDRRSVDGDVIIAVDKFRGSVAAPAAAEAIEGGLREGGFAGRVIRLPIADGGEGTIDAFVGVGFTRHVVEVMTALRGRTAATLAVRGRVAVVEVAQACGVPPGIPSRERALAATSDGVGQLIAAACDLGCTEIVVGVGGTATTDGGRGMLEALGVRFRADGTVDLDGLDPRLRGVAPDAAVPDAAVPGAVQPRARRDRVVVRVATDVDNPLLGPRGAARVFGPQKGAAESDIPVLERRLTALVEAFGEVGRRAADLPGAGAGGGIAFGLMAALGAERVAGAPFVLDRLGLDTALASAQLLITGEGCLDHTSLGGKGAVAAARMSRLSPSSAHATFRPRTGGVRVSRTSTRSSGSPRPSRTR